MLTLNAVEVQKHRLKGPVGYTVVGSPTIVDGVVSGFTNNNYLTIPTYFNVSSSDSCEICLYYTTNQTISVRNYLLTVFATDSYRITFQINQNNERWLWIDDNSGARLITGYFGSQTSNLETGLKISYSNNNLTVFIDHGNGWITAGTYSLTPTFNSPLWLGRSSSAYAPAISCSINLNKSYIKVNGKLWFYQPADTKYIVKDGKLVWADPRIALSGPVNYTVVGSPTIVDNVASGFSSSDYFSLPNLASSSYSTIEIGTKIKTGNEITDAVIIGESSYYVQGILIYGTEQKRISCRCNFGSYVTASSDVVLEPNTEYNLKAVIDKTNGSVSIQVNNAEPVTNNFTVTTDRSLGYRVGGTSTIGYFNGSIYLNETYIKVNDQLWFYGKNYATQNIAPVPAGYTFGNTTTPSIGYVDMRTQQFTAAPSGATIGRDE